MLTLPTLRAWALLATALLAGCQWFRADPKAGVAVVGGLTITREMVDYRAETYKDDPAVQDPELRALAQLVQGNLAAIVVNRYGSYVTYGAVEEFWAEHRAGVSPRVREVADKIPNPNVRLVTIVLPDFAMMVAEEYYRTSPEAHIATGNRAQRVLDRLLADPAAFEAVAAAEKLPVERLWIGTRTLRSASSADGGIVKPAGAPDPRVQAAPTYSDEERAQAAELYQALGVVRAGEVYPRLFSTPDAFQIYKVEARRDGEALAAILTLPKRSFDEWFWTEAADVPVSFLDHDTGLKFMRHVPWGALLFVDRSQYPEVFTAPAPALPRDVR